jgi:hypothetical protein
MKAGMTIAFTICVLLSLCAAGAGCVCPGPGNGGPSPTPAPTASPQPEPGASLTGWGTNGETYARGATATGWVDVTNTGSVPIDEIGFTIVIKRTVLFVPVEKTFSYNATGLDIRPGETKKVHFAVDIPSEYKGVSTAGDYDLHVTVKAGGQDIGGFTKSVKVT